MRLALDPAPLAAPQRAVGRLSILALVLIAGGCAGTPATDPRETPPDRADACDDGDFFCGLSRAAGVVVSGFDSVVELALGAVDGGSDASDPTPSEQIVTVGDRRLALPGRKPGWRWCATLGRMAPLADCGRAAPQPAMAKPEPARPPSADGLSLPAPTATALSFNRTVTLQLAGRVVETADAAERGTEGDTAGAATDDDAEPTRFQGKASFTMSGTLRRLDDGVDAPLRLEVESFAGTSRVSDAGGDRDYRFNLRPRGTPLYRVDLTVGSDGSLQRRGQATGRLLGDAGATVWNERDTILATFETWTVPTNFLLAAPFNRRGLAQGVTVSPNLVLYNPAIGLDRSGALLRSLRRLDTDLRASRFDREIVDGRRRALMAEAVATVTHGRLAIATDMKEFIDLDNGERYRATARTAIRRAEAAGRAPVLSVVTETVTATDAGS